MSLKRDYKTKTDDEKELEPLGGPKSPDSPNKESKTNGVQFGEYTDCFHHSKIYTFLWFHFFFKFCCELLIPEFVSILPEF